MPPGLRYEVQLYRFIGTDSLGYVRGGLYQLDLSYPNRWGGPTIRYPRTCAYESWTAFYRNWRVV